MPATSEQRQISVQCVVAQEAVDRAPTSRCGGAEPQPEGPRALNGALSRNRRIPVPGGESRAW